jgi:hypothetical protein
MKRSPLSLCFVAIGATCVAAVACLQDEHQEPSAESVSLTSASVVEERPIAGAPDEVACQPSSGEHLATTEAPAAPVSQWRTASARAPSAVLARAARKPNRKLDEAIAEVVARANDRSATPRGEEAPPTEGATPPEEIGTGVTTTSATVPAAALAPTRVVFENRLPSAYELERARVLVDGAVVYDARTPGSVSIAPGAHDVQVIASFRLNDPVFTYVRDYRIEVQSAQRVPASAAPLAVVATARSTGGVTTPMNERAGLAWRSFAVN